MSIMNVLTRRATTSAEIISIATSYNNSTGVTTETETITLLGNCIFWEGGAAKSLISDSMREQVSAVALFKPSVTINGNRMRINGAKIYAIVGHEDIANQRQVKVVYLGEIA